MSLTMEEAKDITQTLMLLVMKINGTKNQDGSINTPGLITQLEDLYEKLNPASINFVNNQARKVAEESSKNIDLMLQNQQKAFEDMTIRYQNILKEHENILNQKISKIDQQAKDSVKMYANNLVNDLSNKVAVSVASVTDKIDDIKNIKDYVNMKYLYAGTGAILALMIGMLIGIYIS
ncbi:MAG: hypothetical protein PHE73_08420 [Sulfurovaceae bacterium]|nr:hypothetical protein [Sulfurovaceae bacterium]